MKIIDKMRFHHIISSICLLLCCHDLEAKKAKQKKPKAKSDDTFAPVQVEFLTISNLTDSYEIQEDSYYSDIKGLFIENSNLSHAPLRLLDKFVSLQELTLRDNTIRNFKIERLNSALQTMSKSVRYLRIEKQDLGRLSDDSFVKYKNLTTLHFICTSIHTIEHKAFEGLGKLLVLDMTGNKLKVLKSGTLSPLVSLEVLILKSNQFESLGDIFGGTLHPKLKILHMENNPIKGINYLKLMEICPTIERYEYCIGHKKPCENQEDICNRI